MVGVPCFPCMRYHPKSLVVRRDSAYGVCEGPIQKTNEATVGDLRIDPDEMDIVSGHSCACQCP